MSSSKLKIVKKNNASMPDMTLEVNTVITVTPPINEESPRPNGGTPKPGPEEDIEKVKQKAQEIFRGDMKASEIGPFLGKTKPFNVAVLKEFVKLFDFKGKSLDEAFRYFLTKFSLVGETQEIDRIVEQFSRQYFESNTNQPFKNWTVVHTVVSSILILNTDLHSGMVEKKMTKADFVSNTNMALQENEQLSEEFLKKIYMSIKKEQILLTLDENDPRRNQTLSRTLTTLRPQNSTVQLPRDNSSLYSKSSEGGPDTIQQGLLHKKNVLDAMDKRSANRQWKSVYAVLNDSGLYLYKVDSAGRMSKEGKLLDFVAIRHVLASYVQGYNEERPHVFSILSHTGALTYFQAANDSDHFAWIRNINLVAAKFSAPALAAAIGSGSREFSPPILPVSNTRNTPEQQIEYFRSQIKKFDEDIFEHVKLREEIVQSDGGKGASTLKKITEWNKKMLYLNGELRRYHEYLEVLGHSDEAKPKEEKEKDDKKEEPKTENHTEKSEKGDEKVPEENPQEASKPEKTDEKAEEKAETKVEEEKTKETEAKAEAKAEEVKPEEKAEVKPEEKPEEKVEEKSEAKAEEVEPEEKTEEKAEDKTEVKPEEKGGEKPEEKAEEKSEDKAETKAEEKTEEAGKAEEKPEDKTEAKEAGTTAEETGNKQEEDKANEIIPAEESN